MLLILRGPAGNHIFVSVQGGTASENPNTIQAEFKPSSYVDGTNKVTFSYLDGNKTKKLKKFLDVDLSTSEVRATNIVRVNTIVGLLPGDLIDPRVSVNDDTRIFPTGSLLKIERVFSNESRHYIIFKNNLWNSDIDWPFASNNIFQQAVSISGEDVRTSINPAMQLLDYLENKRYGKGLDITQDIDLESFKQAARDCDTQSDVTAVFTKPTMSVLIQKVEVSGDTVTLTIQANEALGFLANIAVGKTVNIFKDSTSTSYVPLEKQWNRKITASSFVSDRSFTISFKNSIQNPFVENTTVNATKADGYISISGNQTTNASQTAISVGDVYKYPATGNIQFQGTVKSVLHRTYNGYTDTEVTFTNVIGKLGKQWKNWRSYVAGELVWSSRVAYKLASNLAPAGNSALWGNTTLAQLETAAGNNRTNNTANNELEVFLAKVTGDNSSDTQIRMQFGGYRTASSSVFVNLGAEETFGYSSAEGNPFVKKSLGKGQGYKLTGYSLYDSDNVKYWKFCGWEEEPLQRWATRHQMNQVVDTTSPIFDNVNNMLKQFNGVLRYTNGKYHLSIKQEAPKNTSGNVELDKLQLGGVDYFPGKLGDDDIVGSIKVSDKTKKDTYNSLSASIVDPAARFGTRDISFFNSNYLRQDRGIRNSGDAKFPGITNYFNARMNVKQLLDQSRAGLKVSFKIIPKGALLVAGDFIQLTNSRFGFIDKVFRIDQLDILSDGLVQIIAIEHDDTHYRLDNITTSVLDLNVPSGAISGIDGFDIDGPTITAATGGSGTNNSYIPDFGSTDAEMGTVTLTLTHTALFNPNTMVAEIYKNASTNDYNHSNTVAIGTTIENTFTDSNANVGPNVTVDKVIYYWVRYRQEKTVRDGRAKKVTKFSTYSPKLTSGNEAQNRRGVHAIAHAFSASNINYASSGSIAAKEPATTNANNTSGALNGTQTTGGSPTTIVLNTASGGLIFDAGGKLHTVDKDSESDTTNGFFLGYNRNIKQIYFWCW